MSTHDQNQWKHLMIQAQQGNAAAYDTLLNQLYLRLKTYMSQRIFNLNEIEDIIQDVLLSVHNARHSYRPEHPFEPWFYAIARYKFADYIKSQTKTKHIISDDELLKNLQSPKLENNDANIILQDALKQLKPNEQQLLRWLKLEGYTIREVSGFIKKSETATKVMAHRCVLKLKQILLKDLTLLLFVLSCNFSKIKWNT